MAYVSAPARALLISVKLLPSLVRPGSFWGITQPVKAIMCGYHQKVDISPNEPAAVMSISRGEAFCKFNNAGILLTETPDEIAHW